MRTCEVCKNRYSDCSVRECVKKPGHWICFSCCRRCKWSYVALVGIGCKAFDAVKASEDKEGAKREEVEVDEAV